MAYTPHRCSECRVALFPNYMCFMYLHPRNDCKWSGKETSWRTGEIDNNHAMLGEQMPDTPETESEIKSSFARQWA